MTPLAVIGAGGVLGAKVVEQAVAQDVGLVYAYTHGSIPGIPGSSSPNVIWQPLEIADSSAVYDALSNSRAKIVINSAAMTNVDACEFHREQALAANGLGPRHLAEACLQLGVRLIHISTDYVFPGDEAQPGPYFENAPVRPVNYYGWTKLHGEQAIAEICVDRTSWLVVRTALVYGHIPGGRTNFVKWLVGELRAGRHVKIVNDQINTPTFADDLATVLLHLAQRDTEGIVHVSGPDRLSRYEWARIIASSYGLDEGLIDMVKTADLNQPAQRPLQSGLRSCRASEWVSISLRGAREGLDALDIV